MTKGVPEGVGMGMPEETHVVVVGGGFAGVACAKRLAGEQRIRVTLLDKNGYHQFQPLLYQVATAELAPDDIRLTWSECSRHRATSRSARPRS
jgi:NADH dehydrogenase